MFVYLMLFTGDIVVNVTYNITVKDSTQVHTRYTTYHFYSCLVSVYLMLFTDDRVVMDSVQVAAGDNASFTK
jgi:hypothetical protein